MEVQTNGVLSYWNMKSFKQGTKARSIGEFPLYSDAHIVGELNDEKGPYKFLNMISGKNKPGEIYDAVTLRLFWYLENQASYGVKTDTSKYHGGWVTDEIAALISVKLGIRIKAGPITRSYDGYKDDPLGTPRSTRESPPRVDINSRGSVLPCVFKTVNISKLSELYKLVDLSEDQYVALVRASRMFQDALWVAESEPELAWLMLISSIETAACQWSLEKESSVERLCSSKPDLAKLLIENGGESLLESVANEIAHTLGATNKFIKFGLEFMPDAPEVRPDEWARVKWDKPGFKKILDKLYGYRSLALHGGIPFPAPLCSPPDIISNDAHGVAEKGCLALASHTLGASWKAEDLPISMNTFCYFVNGVLNNWWASLLCKSNHNTL